MTELKSGEEMTRDYCELIAREVETLEVLLSEDPSELTCDECGESRGICEGFYGPTSVQCRECGAIESSELGYGYELGDIHEDCGGEFHGETRHAFKNDALELLEELGIDEDETPTIVDYVNAYALDFIPRGEYSTGAHGWTVTACELLRTLGGPGCMITAHDGRTSVEVSVVWGGDTFTKWVYAPTVASSLMELATETAGN